MLTRLIRDADLECERLLDEGCGRALVEGQSRLNGAIPRAERENERALDQLPDALLKSKESLLRALGLIK
jgi:hypothetical protein